MLTRWPVAGWSNYAPAPAALLRSANEIGRLCADAGVPLIAAAFHWSLRDPRIPFTIVGTRTPGDLEATEELLQSRLKTGPIGVSGPPRRPAYAEVGRLRGAAQPRSPSSQAVERASSSRRAGES